MGNRETPLASKRINITDKVMEEWYQIKGDSVHINIKINPGASKNEISGVKDNWLYIRIAAPPINGKANACLCEFLAKIIGCTKSEISLIKGVKSRYKIVSIPLIFNNKLTEFICNFPRK